MKKRCKKCEKSLYKNMRGGKITFQINIFLSRAYMALAPDKRKGD